MKYISYLFLLSLAVFTSSASGDFHENNVTDNQSLNNLSDPGLFNSDCLLKKSDSTFLSPLFYEEMDRNFRDYEVTSATVYTKSYGNVVFPKLLPFNESVLYSGTGNGIKHELVVRRINMADVVFFYSSQMNDSLLVFRSDTVTFLPVRSQVETRYGFDCPGIKYQNSKNRLYRIIEFSGTDCNFANFIYGEHPYYSEYQQDKIPPLLKAGTKEPYHDYLETMMQKLEEYQYEYVGEGKSDSKQKYDKTYNNFKLLLEDIRINGLTPEILQDTMMMDIAKFDLMDSVIRDLRKLGFIERKSVPPDTIQVVKEDDFYKMTGRVFSNILGDVYSNRFEALNFNNPDGSRNGDRYIPGFSPYHPLNYANKFTHFQDYEIVIIPDDGFEGISHIVTIWKKDNKIYSLKFILDKLLHEAIGGVDIDTIFEIDKNRNLIIGTSFGGDAGDTWGSAWVGVWELPRSLKVVFREFWIDSLDKHTKIEYSLLNRKEIAVTEKSFEEEWRDGNFVKLDSSVTRKIILIDSLLLLDHIRKSY
jgi:hypothetical protein